MLVGIRAISFAASHCAEVLVNRLNPAVQAITLEGSMIVAMTNCETGIFDCVFV